MAPAPAPRPSPPRRAQPRPSRPRPPNPRPEAAVAEELLVSRVRSYSSGTPGRALNQARTNHFVIDSSTNPEAVSTVESFLAGVSACGVTMIDGLARAAGLPLARLEASIEGVRL